MKKLPFILLISVVLGIIGWFTFLISQSNLQVLNPKGIIASQQRDLITFAMVIMLAIAIPIVVIAFLTLWKFREGNRRSKHKPDWVGNRFIKISYWAFFGLLVLIFFGIVWVSSHELDPYKSIESNNKPIVIQVVALDWKWLFIYPEENIAVVNFLQIPVNTPIVFKLTADAPMNSFWIPSLGGQIYAMSEMQTTINLMATSIGDFPGGAAEINGKGFSGMRFKTRSSSYADFEEWVKWAKTSRDTLTQKVYADLAKPSENNSVIYYSSVDENLYSNIMNKYKNPEERREGSLSDGH